MAISLTVGPLTVQLNPDLFWSDEDSYHPVEQSVQRTLTGAVIVSSAQRVGGRPITLEGEDDESNWLIEADLIVLRNWAAAPGQVMSLSIRGVPRNVIFRHHDGAAIEARPVMHFSDRLPGDWYHVTLKLMEV